MKYFKDCNCIEELKAAYFRLVMVHHPDKGGNEETMKEINGEYDQMFPKLKDRHVSTMPEAEEEYYTSKRPTGEAPEDFRIIISALVILEGVIVELVGRWVWVTGNTREHRKTLNDLGCKYSGKKKAWHWHHKEDWCYSSGKKSLGEIRQTYGSTVYGKADDKLQLGAGA